MTYDISTRIQYIGTRMRTVNKVSIAYTQGANVYVFNATIQEMSPDELQAAGLSITRQIRRYTYTVGDTATLNGSDTTLTTFLPSRGDTISESGLSLKVIPMSETSPIYKYTTHPRKSVQFHAEVIG